MNEPVGNANRATTLPGSQSHKSRQAAAGSAPVEEREKVESVVVGKVVQRKPNIFKRMTRGMVAQDAASVGDVVVDGVLMPAIRNLVYDVISQGAHQVLFGTARGARRGSVRGAYAPGGDGPVQTLKKAYHQMAEPEASSRYQVSREDQARHNFDELILETQADAAEVLESLVARVERYGSASVADLYDYLGVTGGFTDQKYGWTNLDRADVRHTRRGFILDLPRPTVLR